MIPHIFHRQRRGRSITAKSINQTQDDVRRLAITHPGPGDGAFGSPGGLVGRTMNALVQIVKTGANGIPGLSGGSTQFLGTDDATLVSLANDGNGAITVFDMDPADPETITFPIYNLSGSPIPPNTMTLCLRAWGVFLAVPLGTDIYQCYPATAPGAATGSFPYTPTYFKADVYTLDKSPTQVATAAAIYNNAPVALSASKVTLIKSNGDGTFSVINQVC